jgi:uncharacterized protein YuzE
MPKSTSFAVSYDSDADVLYISKRRAEAARGLEDKYGFVWRYDGDGKLIGLTVTDFQHFWHSKRDLLAKEIAAHFEISTAHADVVLESVGAAGGDDLHLSR